MRIGLVRHFEVNCLHKYLLSSDEFEKWVKEYDCSSIRVVDTVVDTYKWEKCYCSDLPRAIDTAKYIYKGNILKSSLIREVPIMPVFKSRIKLPHLFWLIAGRIAWFLSHPSQTELIMQTKDRVEQFVSNTIKESEASVLVVTHGFLMLQLQKELKKRGFLGERFRNAKCGKFYLFEK
ncbi:MAG: Phosphoglycerate mutase [Firmicutes bacterium]|nr:Phosphoglycerate mutase [Bacillota bacterium]